MQGWGPFSLVLAISDGWVIGLSVSNLAITTITLIGLAWVAQRQRRSETQEATIGELVTSVAIIGEQVKQINGRLGRGDETFDSLGEAAQRNELKTQAMVAELRTWVVSNAASKDDLARLEERLNGLQMAQARHEAQAEKRRTT